MRIRFCAATTIRSCPVDTDLCVHCVWNVMAQAQKPDFVFRRNGRVHLNRRGRQFSRLLAGELCSSAVVMLDTPMSEVVWDYWLTTPFASFPFTPHPSPRASTCANTIQLDSTTFWCIIRNKRRLSHPIQSRIPKGMDLYVYLHASCKLLWHDSCSPG